MNLPTLLTLSRIFLIPVFMVVVSVRLEFGGLLSAAVFTVAAITDTLDGAIARRTGQESDFGRLLDPLADKLMVTAALVALVERGELAAWVAVLILGREFAVSGIRLLAVAKGIVIGASPLGKWKTVAQVVAIVAMLIDVPFDAFLLGIAVFLTILSGADYFIKSQGIWKRDHT